MKRLRLSRRTSAAWIMMLAGMIVSGPAAADCAIQINGLNTGIFYDPLDPIDYEDPFTIKLTQTSGNNCEGDIFFENQTGVGQFTDGQGNTITYTIAEDSAGAPDLINSTTANPAHRQAIEIAPFKDPASLTLHLVLRIAAEQSAFAGNYADTLNAIVQRGAGRIDNSVPITFSATTNPVLELRVESAPGSGVFGKSGVIDFGNLVEGESATLDLAIKSTVDYVLSVDSDNGGRLCWEQSSPACAPVNGFQTFVDYSLAINGRVLNLGSGTVSTASYGDTQNAPDQTLLRSMDVTIGSVASKRAGLYGDWITITVLPAAP